MSGAPSPVRRVRPHLLGPSLPALSALWQTGGRRGVTAAVCIVVPLAVGVALGRPELGSAAALGALTAVYGHALPYRRRAVVVAAVGVTLAVAGTLGALTGPHPVLLSLLCGALAAGAAAATVVWRVGPPGPLGIVLVAGGSSALGTAGEPGLHLLAAAGGAALAWIGCMLPWLWDPTGPERRALLAAEDAVAAVERGEPGTTRPGAVARAVRVADAAVRGGSRRDDGSLRARLDALEQRFMQALPATPPGTGPLPEGEPRDPRWWHAPWASTGLRIGVGAGAAGLIATALGLASPYWAVSTAVGVQLGTDARATRARALHRATGTVLGVLVAALLIWLDLPLAVEIALVGVLQLGVELLIVHQYVLAVAFITPLVLLLVHIGVPTLPGVALVGERLAETAVGIVLALAVGLTLLARAASRRLPGTVGTAADAAVAASVAPPGSAADGRLHDALVQLNEVATAARAELLPPAQATAWLRRSRWVADLGWGLLGARARRDDALAGSLARRIADDLAR
ncbi:FUSC family protein [Geodermatophilus ruber]|uniref:FUSC family protein n=1 Tax=Geodermatophilus ruber TaxID=504800 RepID=UPI00116040E8|nr:FUSC family protein [Geodermatophilus ruber]